MIDKLTSCIGTVEIKLPEGHHYRHAPVGIFSAAPLTLASKVYTNSSLYLYHIAYLGYLAQMTDVPTLTSGKRGPTRTKAKKPPTKSASLVCSHLDCAQELPRHHFWKNGVSDDHLEDEENPICVASRWDEELKSMEGLSENDQWNVLHKYIQQYRDWQESFPRRNKRLSQAETSKCPVTS